MLAVARIGLSAGSVLRQACAELKSQYGDEYSEFGAKLVGVFSRAVVSLAGSNGVEDCECATCLLNHIKDEAFTAIKDDKCKFEDAESMLDVLDGMLRYTGECLQLEEKAKDL